MSFENTVKELRGLLAQVTQDLEKSTLGNKAASQRVRTGTVRLEKISKQFRKESILDEKHSGPSRSRQKAAGGKTAKRGGSTRAAKISLKAFDEQMAPKGGKTRSMAKAGTAAKPKRMSTTAARGKTASSKTASKAPIARSQTLSMKKPTAKLPARKPRSW